tara:strand:- start:1863 stop:4349 length:2487 start_codon:yes stop_codon:yes gene_type:complete
MVVICDEEFKENNKYETYFRYFPNITLSNFQKWALKAIVDKEHLLITAHTGSGKTLPAEFAIQYFVSQGKKVIYTSPIKALSNTKLCDLRRKYPNISFGIVTGDITDNPDADVLIMTTEILPNTIINRKLRETNEKLQLSFEMDIDNELAAVVFDEVHYINDPERGGVWEQAILMLPPQVQLIMLSATIDKPVNFATWIEEQKNHQCISNNIEKKSVYLAPTNHRVVPLTHYFWITAPKSLIKQAKGTKYESLLLSNVDKPITIKDEKNVFNDEVYHMISDINNYLSKRRITRQHVLNNLIRHLKNENGLPAICFLFSRKNVEIAASEINFTLFDEECTTPNTIEQECRQIIMKKLPNYKEFLILPEYVKIIDLYKKGIGIHHAGILPVFREITEMLFEQKKLKLLFATETLAVGINFSTTSVIYTNITKFDGNNHRILAPHEYTQISGRAGRRGIDKVGKVWLCANLFNMDNITEFKNMLTGKPQTLQSKFKFSFNLALNLCATNNKYNDFTTCSLITNDINKEVEYYNNQIEIIQNDITQLEKTSTNFKTDLNIIVLYQNKLHNAPKLINKKRKTIMREITNIENENKDIKSDLEKYNLLTNKVNELKMFEEYKKNAQNYINKTSDKTINLLKNTGFIDDFSNVTELGLIAGQFQEIHPLVISKLILETDYFNELSSIELVGLFSCFISVTISEDERLTKPHSNSEILNTTSQRLHDLFEQFHNHEVNYNTDSGCYYNCIFDVQQYCMDWCVSTDKETCMNIMQELLTNNNIFSGEFIKGLLKINNISNEFEKVAEMQQRLDLVDKLKNIAKLTLKFVATSQSLYV